MFPSPILLLTIQLFLRTLILLLPHERLARDFEWFRHNLAFNDLNSTKDVLISAVKLALTLSLFSSAILGHHHTLFLWQSEWPKDKPFLLMHSRLAKNLWDPKMKRIFEIAWSLFEIILFIHFYPLKQALGRSEEHSLKKNYNGLLCTTSNVYVWPKKFFEFHAWVKKCRFGNFSEGLIWHSLTHA